MDKCSHNLISAFTHTNSVLSVLSQINRTLLYGSSDLMKTLPNGNLIIHLKQIFILQNVLSSSNVNFLSSFIFSLANSGYKGMFSPANSTCPLLSCILLFLLCFQAEVWQFVSLQDVKFSTIFPSSTKYSLVPRASWLLSLFLAIACAN